jgi:signal transduction histidine kinase/ActR/RegA family two-component response regulator
MVIDVEVTSHELSFAGRLAQLVLAKDVTERKRLEEQFRHAQKMEAIGRLAGGVAHDMNNMLTVINGYSNLLREEMAPEEPSRNLLEEIRKATERCTSICRQLLAYSRKQVLAPRVLDLNALVRGAERMLSRLLGEDIEFATVTDPLLDRVRADPGQIEQILMNLAVNALDAMPRGGRLTIRTANVVLDEASRHEHTDVVPGAYVLLSVTDTGCGMSEEVQARIFEPFFTTKEVGKGTGLGLATVYGIVKQTGGHIQVKSAVGQGTTFDIYLPAHHDPAEPAEPARTEAVLPVTTEGSEMVLVAEDEDSLRRMIGFALRQQGYTVLEARNGPDALRKSQELTRPLDLLVTDVAMPQMSGRELAQQLTGRFPGVKVLYISGYTDDVVLRHGLEEAKVNFLHKPFPLTVLARKVREVLDSGRSITAGALEVSPIAQS